jgi:hypothetical protein
MKLKFTINNLLRLVALLLLTASCTTNYTHSSGNNSNKDTDSRSCGNQAKLNAPTYICRNPLMCAPDEFGIAIDSISRNSAYYDQCMLQKGYRAQ